MASATNSSEGRKTRLGERKGGETAPGCRPGQYGLHVDGTREEVTPSAAFQEVASGPRAGGKEADQLSGSREKKKKKQREDEKRSAKSRDAIKLVTPKSKKEDLTAKGKGLRYARRPGARARLEKERKGALRLKLP